MKTILSILFFLLLCLQGCKKDSPESSSLGKCQISEKEGWFIEYEIKEVTGTVYKIRPSTDLETVLISLEDEHSITVIPCILPTDFRIDNTKVIVSGKIYNHPTIDFSYPPMELSSIKSIK